MKWVDQDLHNLLTKNIDDLLELYPEQNRKNLIRRQQEYRKKEREMGERLPSDNEGLRPSKTWEAAAYDKENGEWVHTQLHSYEHVNKSLLVKPVELAPIPPDRRKPPKRDHKVILVFSDAQVGYRNYEGEMHPIHDEAAIKAMLHFAYNLRPDVVVDNGDTTDFAELSRFGVDSDHFQGTLQPSLQRTHNLFAEVTAVTPGAQRVTVWSNHVKRLTDYLLKNAPALYNVRAAGEKYPAMSYPGLLKLDQIGWEYVDGYPGEWRYADDLAFMHGTFAVSNGSTANKLSKANYGRNVVQGHKHSMETHYHTDRAGRQLGAFVVGALCRIDGVVPSYHSSVGVDNRPVKTYENWQQGIMVIADYGDGIYDFRHVPIQDGKIYYDGKTYGGQDEQVEA